MKSSLRPPAVPLVTADPYFSVWSTADRLTDDFTRHWTGQRQAMTGLIRIDGETWRFAGKAEPDVNRYYTEPPAMRQTDLSVTPLSSVYRFETPKIGLAVRFTTPLLLDDPELLARPASYVSFEVSSRDGIPHEVALYFDVTGEWCVDRPHQSVVWERGDGEGISWLCMGSAEQSYLGKIGDDLRIDWGRFYLNVRASGDTTLYADSAELRKSFVRNAELGSREPLSMPRAVSDGNPVMAAVFELGSVGNEPEKRIVVLAYDDVYAVEYFGKRLQAYWKRTGQSAERMIASAFEEYESIMDRCDAFDRQMLADGTESGGERYADILALSYRQAIAAHKLVSGPDGELLFLSKECYSNGCMATVDVSYPSVPLFLLYNPDFVEGMLRPIFKYAGSGEWPFEFAPHDIGTYPLGNGQVYGENKLEFQMPVEECGNMLIMTAAVCLAKGGLEFAAEHMGLLERWARYLSDNGLDPDNQLCTDDFAGHLARNANLSVKAVMGVAGFALLKEMEGGESEAAFYRQRAEAMAAEWRTHAYGSEPYSKLAFGQEGSWSLKYNLIWDALFGTGLFGQEIFDRETAWYLRQSHKYGTPLDNRQTYTKGDWLVWSAALSAENDVFVRLVEPLWHMLNETPDRVPFSDWTDTLSARQLNFQHRSVVGGMFIKLLKDKGIRQGQTI